MKNESVEKPSINKIFFAVIILSLLVSFATCYFTTPTVFGGRDQGAIATAAIDLAKFKSFTFSTPISHSLFSRYGAGKALNYPGFDYTKGGKLISRFPKAYIVYLAIFYGLFGLAGIQYANFIPLVLFLILFWLSLRYFFPETLAFFGFLTALTFFPFLWFAKYTLTEIFMLFLVWAGIYYFLSYLKNHEGKKYIILSLSSFALSALTRIEGLAFLIIAIILFFVFEKREGITLSKKFRAGFIIIILMLLLIYVISNYHDLLDSAKNLVKTLLPGTSKDSAPSVNLYSHLFVLFLNYNLLIYVILGIAGILIALKNIKKSLLKPETAIFLILFPAFFILFCR